MTSNIICIHQGEDGTVCGAHPLSALSRIEGPQGAKRWVKWCIPFGEGAIDPPHRYSPGLLPSVSAQSTQ